MIKIQEHLNLSKPDIFLNQLAKEHWENLNPKIKGRFTTNSLMEKCKKFYKRTDNASYIKEYANNDPAIALRQKKLFMFLKKNNFKELKRIIISRPTEFAQIKTEILKIINEDDLFVVIKGKVSQTKFGKLFTNNFLNYTKFRSSNFCKQLYTKLGFQNATCPYRNDSKVEIVKKDHKLSIATSNIAYFDLDHFYPKCQNPYFALAFFNLIPSCHRCNSTEKGDKIFDIETHINPFCEAFEDFFRFEISLKVHLGHTEDKISIVSKKSRPNDKTISDLNLQYRYENRLNDSEELVKFYLNNYRRYDLTKELSLFQEFFFEFKGVPKDRAYILNKERGKLFRDILKQIDEKHNLLNIN